MTFWRGHIAYILIIATLGLGAFEWMREHDARILAQQQVKESEAEIGSLRSQIAARDSQAQKQVQVIVKQQKNVTTPEQAVASMPDVSSLPANSFRAVGEQFEISAVDMVPLYNELAEGRKCSIELTACQADMSDELQIQGQQAQEIKALQKATGKKSFLAKIVSGAKLTGALGGVAVVAYELGKIIAGKHL